MRTDILEQKEQILKWIEEKQSKAFISKKLSCKPETLDSYLYKMGIVYGGNKSGKGIKKSSSYKTAKEYSQEENVKSHKLKEKLIREKIKEYRCEKCGNSKWNGQPIPLELHHKDGNHYNNDLDNLVILCPNCHAQEPNNAGAAKKKINHCLLCGKEISNRATYCKSCARKKDSCPYTREELKEKIRTQPFTTIANENNVSDNTIRKWCDKYNLPRTKLVINAFSDKEWLKI